MTAAGSGMTAAESGMTAAGSGMTAAESGMTVHSFLRVMIYGKLNNQLVPTPSLAHGEKTPARQGRLLDQFLFASCRLGGRYA